MSATFAGAEDSSKSAPQAKRSLHHFDFPANLRCSPIRLFIITSTIASLEKPPTIKIADADATPKRRKRSIVTGDKSKLVFSCHLSLSPFRPSGHLSRLLLRVLFPPPKAPLYLPVLYHYASFKLSRRGQIRRQSKTLGQERDAAHALVIVQLFVSAHLALHELTVSGSRLHALSCGFDTTRLESAPFVNDERPGCLRPARNDHLADQFALLNQTFDQLRGDVFPFDTLKGLLLS